MFLKAVIKKDLSLPEGHHSSLSLERDVSAEGQVNAGWLQPHH